MLKIHPKASKAGVKKRTRFLTIFRCCQIIISMKSLLPCDFFYPMTDDRGLETVRRTVSTGSAVGTRNYPMTDDRGLETVRRTVSTRPCTIYNYPMTNQQAGIWFR